MPTYVYEREDGSRFEAIEKITAEPLDVCPDTKQKVKRIPCWQGMSIITGWSPDKERRKDKLKKEGPKDKYGTTLDKYRKQIEANTKKAQGLNDV